MQKLKKYIIKIMFIVCFMLTFWNNEIEHNILVCAEEYSEKEKAAAKAWLSAHGYSPTREGAAQAYQDYLNGKFDDDPQVQAAKQANEQETNGATEAKKTKKKKAKKKSSKNNDNSADTGAGMTESVQTVTTQTDNSDSVLVSGTEDKVDLKQSDVKNEITEPLSSEEIAADNYTESSDERTADNAYEETEYDDTDTKQSADSFPTSMYLLLAIGLCIIGAGVACIIFLKH